MYTNYAAVLESYMITEESFNAASIGRGFKNFGAMIKQFIERVVAKIREFFSKHFTKGAYVHKTAAPIYQKQLDRISKLAASRIGFVVSNINNDDVFDDFKKEYEEIREMTADIRAAIIVAPDKTMYIKSLDGVNPSKACDNVVKQLKEVKSAYTLDTPIEKVPPHTSALLTMLSNMIDIALANYKLITWMGNHDATSVEFGNVTAHKM